MIGPHAYIKVKVVLILHAAVAEEDWFKLVPSCKYFFEELII